MSGVVAALSRSEAQSLTEDIRNHTAAAWTLLIRAHNGKAWKALGYTSWVEYVGAEFDIGKSRSYQILDQARVIQAIEAETSTKVDISEREARDIKDDLPAVVEKAREAVASLPEGAPEPEKRAAVKAVIDQARPVVSIKTKETVETTETFDAQTGEVIEPAALTQADAERLADADQRVKDSGYMRAFYAALPMEWSKFDAERIAHLADERDMRTIEIFAQSAARFCEKVRRARSGLRLIEGGKR